jgi:predicted flap endonuclease-1-like 5' DNA nuclease
MLYFIETGWGWFVVAGLAGAAVGYWTASPKDPLLHGGWLRWVAIAFVVGLVVAIFGWLPDRAGLYLETLLGVVFSYVVGSLVGGGLRKAWARVEAAAARRAATPTTDEASETGAAVGSRVDATTVAQELRQAADAKAAEEARQAADAKAAEEARRAADAKAAEEARRAADAKAAEETRRAVDAKAVEEARRATDAKAAEAAPRAADAKTVEATRRTAAAKAAEEMRRGADSKATVETRRAAPTKNGRRVADTKAAEETRRAAPAKAAEEVRRAADAEAGRAADERVRQAVHAKAAEEAHRAADAEARRTADAEARRAADEAARQAVHAQAAKEVYRAADAEAAAEARRAADAKTTMGRRLTETSAKEAQRTAGAKPAEAHRPAARPAAVEPIRSAATRSAPPPQVASTAPSKPAGIDAPLHGEADDLKLIKGIGGKNEKICNDLGVYHLAQIADWSSNEAAWVGQHMAFPGRVEREHWIAQAKLLASGGDTEHSAGIKAGTIALDEGADAPLDEAQSATLVKLLPEQAAPVENEARHAGRRPYGLLAPRDGQRDNLKRIRGIGPQNEGRLNGVGIWHYGQIAAWSAENIKWIGSYLAVSGRIERERWIDQAKELAAGRDTEFSRRTASGKNSAATGESAHGQRNSQVVEPRKEG